MATKGEQEKKDEPVGQAELPPETVSAIFSGTAVYANRIFVTINPLGARITFIEHQEGAPPQFRTAAYLNILDAISLRDLLNRQIGQLEAAVTEAVAEAEPSPAAEQ